MGITAVLTGLLIQSLAIGSTTQSEASCTFWGTDAAKTVQVGLQPMQRRHPSGPNPVRLALADQTLVGSVSPVPQTEIRDVVLRGVDRDNTMYLISIAETGAALMFVVTDEGETSTRSQQTGRCLGHLDIFGTWLSG